MTDPEPWQKRPPRSWTGRQGPFPWKHPDGSSRSARGKGPFLCVSRDGAHAGSVELLRFPLDGHGVISEALDRGTSEREALSAAASETIETVERDRRSGHGADYRFVGEGPTAAAVAGEQGVRSGFRGMRDGRVVERVVQYWVINGDSVCVMAATAAGRSGGNGFEGEFEPETLEAFADVLSRIAAASRL